MRCCQTFGGFSANPEHFRSPEDLFMLQSLVQWLALQKLHGHVGHAAVFSDLVDRHDVVMDDRGSRLGLAEETFSSRFAGTEGRQHDLQGDFSLEMGIFRLVNNAHSTMAKDLENAIWA